MQLLAVDIVVFETELYYQIVAGNGRILGELVRRAQSADTIHFNLEITLVAEGEGLLCPARTRRNVKERIDDSRIRDLCKRCTEKDPGPDVFIVAVFEFAYPLFSERLFQ